MSYHVLLVDDDVELVEMLSDYLTREGLHVTVAQGSDEGVDLALRAEPDLVVLDVMMPGFDGIEALRRIRKERPSVPVVMLTARGDDCDKIIGLELGADDYIPKPCTPRELLARIRGIMRRVSVSGASLPRDLMVGSVTLSRASRSVTVKKRSVRLTSTEFSLLEALLQRPGRLVTKAELSRAALGRPYNRYERSVDMHISRLRQKLAEAYGSERDPIETVISKGYQWILQ